MTEHILDNPAWHAMVSFNSHLAFGDDDVRYFPENVSPFAGLRNPGAKSLSQLFDMLPAERVIASVTARALDIPNSWKILYQASLLQMTGENFMAPGSHTIEISSIGKQHVPQMLSLTKLTNPGPFAGRTIEFGNYTGIFDSGELVAMAGQRLHPFNYIEISAVCTHPDHAGKGYGKALVAYQAEQILSAGSTPFLHTRGDNTMAIRLYERLGFTVRREVMFYVIQKPLHEII